VHPEVLVVDVPVVEVDKESPEALGFQQIKVFESIALATLVRVQEPPLAETQEVSSVKNPWVLHPRFELALGEQATPRTPIPKTAKTEAIFINRSLSLLSVGRAS